MPCSANAQQGRKNGLERCRYDSGFWGKHVKLILRGFSHPDYTVGFGIAPNQPVFETGSQTAAKTPFTAGSELHSTLKLSLVYHPFQQLSSNFFMAGTFIGISPKSGFLVL